MRKPKHIVSLFLCFVLILGLLPISAMAKEVNTLVLNAACLFSGTAGETTEFTFTTGKAGVYRFDLKDTNPQTHGGHLRLYSGTTEIDPYSSDDSGGGEMEPMLSYSWNLSANTTYQLTHKPDENVDTNTTHHYSLKPSYAGAFVDPTLSAGQAVQIKFLNVGAGCEDYYVAHFHIKTTASRLYRLESANGSSVGYFGQLPQTVCFLNGKSYDFYISPASQSVASVGDTLSLSVAEPDATLTETSTVKLADGFQWVAFTAASAGTYSFKINGSESLENYSYINDEMCLEDPDLGPQWRDQVTDRSMQRDETVYFYVRGSGQMSVTKTSGSTTPDPEPDPDPANKPLKLSGDFSYHSEITKETAKYTYSYDESWFLKSGTEYQHDLARMSIRMAMAAARQSPVSIKDLFEQLNFSYSDSSIVYPTPTKDSIGYAIGSKRILDENGQEFTLVAVAVRGGGYEDEWASNFTVGTGDEHQGFSAAGNTVAWAVREYISDIATAKNVKVWITGYSRAAATSNIAAQRLNEWAKQGSIKGLSTSGIYAYCFECPQGARTASTKYNEVYSNIHNIVNDFDVVTKVAPKNNGWNYTRYGITYQIPSSGLLSLASKKHTEMLSHYIDIVRSANKYQISAAEAEQQVMSHASQLSSQGLAGDFIVSSLSQGLVSPGVYTTVAQNSVRNLATKYLGSGDANVGDFLTAFVTLVGSTSIKNSFSLLPEIEQAALIETIMLHANNIRCAHFPELCLAWMDTISGAGEYADSRTRKLYVNCPVDVSVYDSNNKLVAQITNDSTENSPEDGIPAFVDYDGQKIIMLPSDEDYRVELTATDSGEMTYMVSEYDVNDGSTDKLVSYHQVPIAAGDEFTGEVENLEQTSDAQYPLESASGAITPTVKQQGDDVKQYTVTVKTSGNGAAYGGGYYLSGEYTKLTAEPKNGESFLGWYINGALVSEELEYRMLVSANTEVVAKFTSTNSGGSSSGGGGGGGAVSTYPIKASAGANGSISPSGNVSVQAGKNQTFTITPDKGYAVSDVKIDGKSVGAVKSYTFENVKSSHTIEAIFTKANDTPQNSAFVDVPEGSYYEEAVNWAVGKGITTGTDATHFSPDESCTRAQAVTFLWRAAGSPTPKSSAMSFVDVPSDSYYYDAVLWAVESGITKGTSDTTFSPNTTCSRAQIVTFLWRGQNAPTAGSSNPFTDVAANDYYADAVLWAVKENVTNGTSNTTFSPDDDCTRAQIVTFIWRTMA